MGVLVVILAGAAVALWQWASAPGSGGVTAGTGAGDVGGSVEILETVTVGADGIGAAFGMSYLVTTFEVRGPTSDAAVVCKFSGWHRDLLDGLDDPDRWLNSPGWIVYTKVADLRDGESTRGTCEATTLEMNSDEDPSFPIVSMTSVDALETPPPGWSREYAPPTPWP